MQLLFLVHLTLVLVDTGAVAVRVTTEGHVQAAQETVATGDQGLGGVGVSVNGRLTVEDNDTVGKIGGHDKVVLDNEGSLLGVHNETLDDSGSDNTLFRVEVRTRLVDQVNVGRHSKSQNNSDTLQFTTGQVLHFLVDEVVNLERLVDVGLELRRQESGLDPLEEQLAHSTLELGGDLLGLHADVHAGHRFVSVRLLSTSKHLTEGSLASSVLSHHNDNFRISKPSAINAQLEVAQSLAHAGVGERTPLVGKKFITGLSDTEGQRLISEPEVLGGNVTIQENVDTFTDRGGEGDHTKECGSSVEHTDKVGEIVQHGQIVLYNNDIVIRTKQLTNGAGSRQTLLDIKIRRRLVKHVTSASVRIDDQDGNGKKNQPQMRVVLHIGFLDANQTNGKPLKFSSGKILDVTASNLVEFC